MAEEVTNYQNAVEAWPLYDTVQIGKGLISPVGYASYADLPQKIPFFNVRTEGEVGSAMCNLESKDSLAFGYRLHSVGLMFRPPTAIIPKRYESNAGSNAAVPLLFAQDIPQRCALRLQIRQDDKLLANAYLAPEGTGPYGFGLALGIDPILGPSFAWSNNVTTGEPMLSNRWTFKEPLIMPRGCTFRAYLEIDDYGKSLLAGFSGPSAYEFTNETGQFTVPARALIRVSLIGKREVQQRNALHV